MTAKIAFLLASFCAPAWAGGAFVTVLPDKPSTLDPAAVCDHYSLAVAFNIYEPLLFFGDTYSDFKPAISSETPSRENGLVSPDGLVYTFPIRKDVKFHDGTPLTAEDVRYSLVRLMMMDAPGRPAALFLRPLLGVGSIRGPDGGFRVKYEDFAKAVRADGSSVVITLKKPYSRFLEIAASWPFVMSKSWTAAHGGWDGAPDTWQKHASAPSGAETEANGTGPFRLENFTSATGRAVLARNGNYWRAPARANRLVFLTEPSENTRQAMLEAGDADFADFSRASLPHLRGMKTVTITEGLPNRSVKFAAFNFAIAVASNPMAGSGLLDGKGVPPDFFADENARKGFAFALDYGKLLDMSGGGAIRPATPLRRPGGPESPPYSLNPEKAARHLKKAHGGRLWKNGFYIEAVCGDGDYESRAAMELLACGLKKLNPNFRLRVKTMPLPELLNRLPESRFPIFALKAESDTPGFYGLAFTMLHSEGAVPYAQHYRNPQADKYLDGAFGGAIALEKLDRIYAQDAPYMLLFTTDAFVARREGAFGPDALTGVFALHNYPDYYKVEKR
ncbi:MAG: ABC transporter substrate-binding protein [Elusimicrobiales bacterium]